jgi:hypothetical protein
MKRGTPGRAALNRLLFLVNFLGDLGARSGL